MSEEANDALAELVRLNRINDDWIAGRMSNTEFTAQAVTWARAFDAAWKAAEKVVGRCA